MSGEWLEILPGLHRLRRRLPEAWAHCPADKALRLLRWRLQFTQEELARKAGMPQIQVSRLEGGSDALVSTWRRLFSAMGFDLALIPIPRFPPREIEAAAERGRPWGWRRRDRFKPRMRKKDRGGSGEAQLR